MLPDPFLLLLLQVDARKSCFDEEVRSLVRAAAWRAGTSIRSAMSGLPGAHRQWCVSGSMRREGGLLLEVGMCKSRRLVSARV